MVGTAKIAVLNGNASIWILREAGAITVNAKRDILSGQVIMSIRK